VAIATTAAAVVVLTVGGMVAAIAASGARTKADVCTLRRLRAAGAVSGVVAVVTVVAVLVSAGVAVVVGVALLRRGRRPAVLSALGGSAVAGATALLSAIASGKVASGAGLLVALALRVLGLNASGGSWAARRVGAGGKGGMGKDLKQAGSKSKKPPGNPGGLVVRKELRGFQRHRPIMHANDGKAIRRLFSAP
jgi:hypothetical protein